MQIKSNSPKGDKMSEHTKEPWSVYEGEQIHGVIDSEGKHLAEMWQRKQYNSLENARRIVACVNACAGIDTERLEAPGGIAEIIAKYREENKELRKKCTGIQTLQALDADFKRIRREMEKRGEREDTERNASYLDGYGDAIKAVYKAQRES